MYIEQIYTKCLAQGSYYIESDGEAVIIDPIRDIDIYIQKATERKASIKYIFETHFHADFVSGHIDLAKKTGATIVYGPNAKTEYAVKIASDMEEITVGDVSFTVLHTPGHTMESTCYLLKDHSGKDHAIFTGDTLFIGDVGRPDLAVKSDLTQDDLAGYLFESIQTKLLPLPDDVIVYPGHGAGSACGKNMSKETVSTIGDQRKNNYALQHKTKDEFVQSITCGLSKAPSYFSFDVKLNKEGYRSIDELRSQGSTPLSVEKFSSYAQSGALIIDSRTPDEYEKGAIPGSYSVGLNGQYAVWAASLIPLDKDIILIANEHQLADAIDRLARVGFEQIKGYLKGGIDAWKDAGKSVQTVESIEPIEFAEMSKTRTILDVRKPGEFGTAHIKNAVHASLEELEHIAPTLTKSEPYLIHCAGGYRSMIAASILKQHGFDHVINVKGGFGMLKQDNRLEIV
mgnify:CR=1 FL=1